VLEDGTWRRLPEQEVVIGGWLDWSWTGDRIVCATTQRADGGEVNGFGRSIPHGGYLDPASGRWSELPTAPQRELPHPGGPLAAGGRWIANREGLVLDTERDRWLLLPRQPDAPDQDEAAAWAAGRLVVWGGATGTQPADPNTSELARPIASGAVWTPPAD
jgi:hypothetical protein